jgi:NAD(P)H dehydrogenase (quinone)
MEVHMNVFIVHAHPEPHSFNAALTDTAVRFLESAGHTVQVSDLYAMQFDPVSDRRNFTSVADAGYFKQQREELHASETGGFAADVLAEIEKLEWCDALILQFPLWWFGMPAILKGWADRILVMGRIYGGGRWYDNGTFAGKRAMLSLTTGGPESIYLSDGLNGDIQQILYPINHGILRFTGFDVLPPFIAWGPAHADNDTRTSYLAAFRQRLVEFDTSEPMAYSSLDAYDPATYQLKNKEM